MLYLLLCMGNARYALEARRIVEVVPMVDLKPLPHSAAYVAGLFDYRGELVPVIDLCRLTADRPCRGYLTTRIVLVDYPGADGRKHILGLLAEQVTETAKLNDDDFQSSGVRQPEAQYLGPLQKSAATLIQRLEIEHLLPDELRRNLFAECA
ncbi:MAG TPA: chemotaxis protein CheW [Gammaproteobacteria bacterium]